MPLIAGTRLGPYEVVAQIGVGGMGEVYRATDTNLKRQVAIKVLPESVAGDRERLARFQREAEVLAALNHPHIAAIYGVEKSDGQTALIMELVDGPTLADRIAQRPIPIDDALPIAKQIAEALEAAHEQGIIHRDLKPANVKVREDGTVKVLDFGLAKALGAGGVSATAESGVSMSPTITSPAMTQMGMILGTAAYMAPEQAKGRAVDKRADVWAFGCVLYEMLTGHRAFEGEDVSSTLARVLEREPAFESLPASVPPRVRMVLRRCLTKDPRQRARDMGDVRLALEGGFETPTAPIRTGADSAARRRLPWAVAGAALLVALGLTVITARHVFERPAPLDPVSFHVSVPDNLEVLEGGGLLISPDGRHLAFAAASVDRVSRIWLRDLRALDAVPLQGSEGAVNRMFWSADSRWLVFQDGRLLRRIEITGGTPRTLCELPRGAALVGGFTTPDGTVVFGSTQTIFRVPWDGGTPVSVTRLDTSREETYHLLPVPLPDGRRFLYLRQSRNPERSGIFVGRIDGTPDDPRSPVVLTTPFGVWPVESPDQTWHLLFFRDGTLFRQRLDLERMTLVGDPERVATDVASFLSGARFSVSDTGTLVYETGTSPRNRVVLVDRDGERSAPIGQADAYFEADPAPGGRRVALARYGSQTNSDIWLLDLVDGTTTREATGRFRLEAPVWSSDGARLFFRQWFEGKTEVYERQLTGAGEQRLVFSGPEDLLPSDISSDDHMLLVTSGGGDLSLLPLEGHVAPVPLLATEAREQDGHFSPDGAWIAYQSDESGRAEIYVRAWSGRPDDFASSDRWRISREGGIRPRWRADGKELFYQAGDGFIMSVSMTAHHSGETAGPAGEPMRRFRLPLDVTEWEPMPDGSHFLMLSQPADTHPTPFTVMVNWASSLVR